MKVNGRSYRAIWMEDDQVFMIDQQQLPFRFEIVSTNHYLQTCGRIKDMTIRGAGTIGAVAGFAMAQAFTELRKTPGGSLDSLLKAKKDIENTRPTARDLFYAVERVFTAGYKAFLNVGLDEACLQAVMESQNIANQYVEFSEKIGQYGKALIKDHCNILTHCNAGWLALVDYGSALSPVFLAHREGKKVHVWVDETRPRSQGARLTAWELKQEDIPHTIIADNAAGLLMSQRKADLVITGADRIALNGDTANKIGTLEKAVLAKEYNIPFYVAAPSSTFDKNCPTGKDIIIEERSEDEIHQLQGIDRDNVIREIRVTNPGSLAYNPAFDVTPARFISGYITEKGIINGNDPYNILASNH